jgi:hypothetical protein
MASELAQAASKVRAGIKAAVAAGELPPYPEGITFRVRSGRASLMTEVEVYVLGAPEAWCFTRDEWEVRRPSPASRELQAALLEIIGRHYESDGRHRFAGVTIDAETRIPATRDAYLAGEDPDGWDRNGAYDGFRVWSDADPGL